MNRAFKRTAAIWLPTLSVIMVFVSVWMGSVSGCRQAVSLDTAARVDRSRWNLKTTDGTQLLTDHYRIYTTAKDETFQYAAADLAEGQYARFQSLIPRRPKDTMTVYIFSNTRQWIAFTQTKFPPAVANLYLKIRSGGYTSNDFAAFYYLGRFPTLTILAHELFHLYLNQIRGSEPVPAWVNEGLACYFEAHEWDGSRPVFSTEKNLFRRNNLAEAVSGGKLFPLKELLGTDAGRVCAGSQDRLLVYYAQLWGLVQFLQDSHNGYAEKFHKLLAELGTKEMSIRVNGYLITSPGMSFGEAAFHTYITEDLAGFETVLNKYLKKLAGV
jgi:hypothetical protein